KDRARAARDSVRTDGASESCSFRTHMVLGRIERSWGATAGSSLVGFIELVSDQLRLDTMGRSGSPDGVPEARRRWSRRSRRRRRTFVLGERRGLTPSNGTAILCVNKVRTLDHRTIVPPGSGLSDAMRRAVRGQHEHPEREELAR
ncbi:MAG: hypothetical protein NZL87_08620, partial [Thermomicrobium sp.]|nr:hypothetical protein [Thermomicrobium sp.]